MPKANRRLKVFLCHASQDKPRVRELYQHLRAESWIETWLDEKKLLPGQDWRINIEQAVETSDIVIICLSSISVKKEGFIQNELRYAREIALEKLEESIFLIPLRIDECDVPRGLRFYQWADYFGEKKDETYNTLLESLKLRHEQILKLEKEVPFHKEKEQAEHQTAENIAKEMRSETSLIEALPPDIARNDVSPISSGINTIQAETSNLRTDTLIHEPVKPSFPTQSTPQISVEIKDRLTILVPIYNEARIVEELVRGLRAENLIDRYKVILCDDGSADNSFEVMKKYESQTKNIKCIQNKFNKRKVGAIYNMANEAQTKFVLTLDADCILSEITSDALERLMDKMDSEDIAATCFRIMPNDRGLLSKLQKIDYTIFTDSIRQILGVPVCLIGQGVLWKTESLLTVLSSHSGVFDGDDLENTVIALQQGMNIYWERQTILLKTEPKRTLPGLIEQRARSWDFGMFRVLFQKRALSLVGNSGTFYKNLLLLDFFAHPLKIISVPLLLLVPIVNFMGLSFYKNGFSEIFRESIFISFKFGSYGVIVIWLMTVVNAFVCVRGYLPSVLKWSIFSAIYLSSPFVYFLYYPLFDTQYINAYDVLGAAINWLGPGLLFTYLWWVLLTYLLILISSLDRRDKCNLAPVAFLSPLYYFLLLVVCRTYAIIKYLTTPSN